MSNRMNIALTTHATMHLTLGYQEVVDTLAWGLQKIGYDVSLSYNELRPDARNIVFRADEASIPVLGVFPTDTIIYNLEQSYALYDLADRPANEEAATRWDRYVYIRKNFEVWDYSCRNVDAMLTIESKMPVKHVPIGFAPILQRIAKPQNQDIDILIYGMPHAYRLNVFKKLCGKMFRCLFVCGLYGQARDELIGRSKIILSLTGGEAESLFPIVRASYLLANHKLVVSDICPNLHIETDMISAVRFCPTEFIDSFCQYWLSNDSERLEAENYGFNIMAQRDIRGILLAALGRHGDL